MGRGLWERLRAARGFGVLAALALAALLALMLLRGGDRPASGGTELEARLERILSLVNPDGGVRAMVREDGEGNIVGVVLVAEGLRDIATRLALEDAVTTLLQIDSAQVEIIGADRGG